MKELTEEQKLKRRLTSRLFYQNKRKHDPEFMVKNRERTRRALLKRKSTPEGLAAYKLACKKRYQHQKLRNLKEARAGRPRPDRCEVCDQPCRTGKHLAFDHDHKTNTFRGWLCSACNITLGLVKDSPDLLRSLASYLERNQKTVDGVVLADKGFKC